MKPSVPLHCVCKYSQKIDFVVIFFLLEQKLEMLVDPQSGMPIISKESVL